MKQIILQIISPIISFILGYFSKLIEGTIRNRYPLRIYVDSKHLDIGSYSGRMGRDGLLKLNIPITFTNRMPVKFDISLFKFSFQPEEEFKDLKFNILIKDQSRTPRSRFSIEPKEIKTKYLIIEISTVSEDFEWEEFELFLKKFEKNPILNFKYIVAIDSKEKEFNQEIKDFFKNLINMIRKF